MGIFQHEATVFICDAIKFGVGNTGINLSHISLLLMSATGWIYNPPKIQFYFIIKKNNKIIKRRNLIIDAFKDELNVPVHVVQIDDSAKVIVERDAKFLNVDGAKEAALPVKLDAGSFVHVLQ